MNFFLGLLTGVTISFTGVYLLFPKEIQQKSFFATLPVVVESKTVTIGLPEPVILEKGTCVKETRKKLIERWENDPSRYYQIEEVGQQSARLVELKHYSNYDLPITLLKNIDLYHSVSCPTTIVQKPQENDCYQMVRENFTLNFKVLKMNTEENEDKVTVVTSYDNHPVSEQKKESIQFLRSSTKKISCADVKL